MAIPKPKSKGAKKGGSYARVGRKPKTTTPKQCTPPRSNKA